MSVSIVIIAGNMVDGEKVSFAVKDNLNMSVCDSVLMTNLSDATVF